MSVGFDTLTMLAETKRTDVWYLFPRKAVIQQLANKNSGIDDGKRTSLTRIFGCDDWEDRFYRAQPPQGSLFGGPASVESIRMADGDEVAAFARERFGGIFAYVSDPIPLLINGREFFELYCFSNNPPAIDLIKRGVDHVVRKYTPASHRKSASKHATGLLLVDPAPLLEKKRPYRKLGIDRGSFSTHSLSIWRERGPLSPPTIAQCMPVRSKRPTSPISGSNEMKRTLAGTSRR